MTFEHAVPVLPAHDISESVAFYLEVLGFAEGWVHAEGDYGGVSTGTVELHFWRCDHPVVLENCSCRIGVSDGCNGLLPARAGAGHRASERGA